MISGSNITSTLSDYLNKKWECLQKNIERRRIEPKILMVEDNPELLQLLESVMENHFQVVTAPNGKEALQILSQESVDFIISDVMMPELDGVELCARVKGAVQTSHIPFILLTAKSSYEHQLHGYEAGADDYIPKPFNLELMVLKVKTFWKPVKNFSINSTLHLT